MHPPITARFTLLALLFATTAGAAPPNPGREAELRKQAHGARKQAEEFVTLAVKSPGEVAESATNAATSSIEVAEALETLATAVGIGVNQESIIENAHTAIAQRQKQQAAAIERVSIRQAIAGLQPSADAIESLAKTTPEVNKPWIDALVSTRKTALAAGAAAHDAITPEAGALQIAERRDAWIRAQHSVTLAVRALKDANERIRLASMPGAGRPAAAEKLAQIAARDRELLEAHAAVLSGTLAATVADRKRASAADAYAATTWANLTSLTLEQARAWAALDKAPTVETHDGGWHMFDALTSLTAEAAAALAKPQQPFSIPNLAEIAPADESWSLLRKTRRLSLNGLADLSPEVAAALATHPPVLIFGHADLQLNGVKKLSPQAAEALSQHKGMVLLYGLEELDSVPLAQKLARQWGELRLGVKRLSPEIATELAKHRGFETTYPRMNYHGRADGAISVLRIDHIESLPVETARALGAHEGVLVLNDLVSLEPAVAAALAKRVGNRKSNRPGILVLNGLKTLSAESAAALATFTGEIVLKAITDLTPDAAAALAKHQGRLHLTGLTSLSSDCHAALQAHKNLLLPQTLPRTAGQ